MKCPSLKPVAFAAELKDLQVFKEAVLEIEKIYSSIIQAGISNLHFHTQKILDKNIVLATMDMGQNDDPVTLWAEIQKGISVSFNEAIIPHQRYTEAESKYPWVAAETVCKLRPNNAVQADKTSTWHAAVTELKQEKEADYRLLHDNVWPGVVEAIGASNISRFDIFLIEFGENQPHLFYQFQYTGNDFEKDMASQSNSPINQRWWKFTDACQKPLPEAKEGPWLDMIKL